MKFDMGGSAAVLGAAKALGQIKPLGVEVSHLHLNLWLCPERDNMLADLLNSSYVCYLMYLHVQVHFVVAACENMISGTGMRPGDIVTTSNGKTIEVRICYFWDIL